METENTLVAPAASGATIRSVASGRGLEWLVGGFRTVMKTPVFWLLGGLAFLIGNWLLGLFPVIGSMLSTAASVVAIGALMRSAQALEQGSDPVAAAKLAAGSTPLWILGALAAAMTFGLYLSMLVMGVSSMGMFMLSTGSLGPMVMISLLIMLAFGALMFMAFWLAPALVALRGASPVEAIKLSFAASLKNLVPFIVFFVLSTLACIAGAIPFGLGLLLVFPALIASSYIAYQEIFGA